MAAPRRPTFNLDTVSDRTVREVLRQVVQKLQALEGLPGVVPTWQANTDANAKRLTNLAEPVDVDDAATRGWCIDSLPEFLSAQLEAGGDFPLVVTGLRGVLADAQRMGIVVIPDNEPLPPADQYPDRTVIFWRGSMYYLDVGVVPPAWTLLTTAASTLYGTHSDRLTEWGATPTTLPIGTLFWETDRHALYFVRESGGVKEWRLIVTRPYVVAWASKPADLTASGDVGWLIQVSDRGHAIYRWSGTAWVLQYTGEPLRGTLSPDQKPTLTSNDAGLRFHATDFDRVYRWTGSAWEDDAGQPPRFLIAFFNATPEPIGWSLCDGATVTRSTATGGTTSYGLPDLITDNRFLRAAGSAGGTGGTLLTDGPDDLVEVQSGTGVDVGNDTHSHPYTPPYYDALPYMRL